MSESYRSAFTVPLEHPALPGHFPGTPVVPGVVVLDWVLKTMELWRSGTVQVRELKQVKFHAPLLPAERADVTLEHEGATLRFQVNRGAQLIAQGVFVIDDAVIVDGARP